MVQIGSDPANLIEMEMPGVEGLIIGRSDSQSQYPPDLDLVSFKAREQGVSRRHAAFVRFADDIHIVDLGSVNGTFVNSRRLPPDMPYPITPGDRITIGELDLFIVRKDSLE